MKAFVSGNQFVGEGEPWHETALLQPEDSAERTGEKDPFYSCESDESLGKGALFAGQPAHGPVALALDRWHGFKSLEQVILFLLVLDVGVNEKGVGFCVNVLHHNLESIERTCFRPAHFVREVNAQVFVDNTVACGKESENVLEEMLLVTVEVLPILEVFSQINFFGSPEAGHLLLVHLPNIRVLNREQYESIEVLLKHGFKMLLTQVNFKSVIRRVGITVFDDHLHIPLVSFTRWILLAFR